MCLRLIKYTASIGQILISIQIADIRTGEPFERVIFRGIWAFQANFLRRFVLFATGIKPCKALKSGFSGVYLEGLGIGLFAQLGSRLLAGSVNHRSGG